MRNSRKYSRIVVESSTLWSIGSLRSYKWPCCVPQLQEREGLKTRTKVSSKENTIDPRIQSKRPIKDEDPSQLHSLYPLHSFTPSHPPILPAMPPTTQTQIRQPPPHRQVHAPTRLTLPSPSLTISAYTSKS